jgi:hypothetical protein
MTNGKVWYNFISPNSYYANALRQSLRAKGVRVVQGLGNTTYGYLLQNHTGSFLREEVRKHKVMSHIIVEFKMEVQVKWAKSKCGLEFTGIHLAGLHQGRCKSCARLFANAQAGAGKSEPEKVLPCMATNAHGHCGLDKHSPDVSHVFPPKPPVITIVQKKIFSPSKQLREEIKVIHNEAFKLAENTDKAIRALDLVENVSEEMERLRERMDVSMQSLQEMVGSPSLLTAHEYVGEREKQDKS